MMQRSISGRRCSLKMLILYLEFCTYVADPRRGRSLYVDRKVGEVIAGFQPNEDSPSETEPTHKDPTYEYPLTKSTKNNMCSM